MGLTRSIAVAIVRAVARNGECRDRITNGAENLAAGWWGPRGNARNLLWAGWRSLLYQMTDGQLGDYKYICTGIAEATADVISRAGIGGIDSALAWPDSDVDNTHWGTKIELTDGSCYVFDWWFTLNPWNPIISTPAQWAVQQDGTEFVRFTGLQGGKLEAASPYEPAKAD